MSTEAIVLQNENQAIEMGGIGLAGPAALRPELMVLVQPTTDGVQGIPPGVFLDKTTGMQFQKLEMVLFEITEPRAKYPSAKFVRGEKPICRSDNGLVPITDKDDLIPQAPACGRYDPKTGRFVALCEHASWKNYDNKTKTGQKPTCRSSRKLVFIEKATGAPFKMIIAGTNVKSVDNLRNALNRAALMSNAKNRAVGNDRRMNIFDYVVTLESEKANDGPYYNYKFVKIDPMRKEEAAEYGPLYQALMARREEIEAELDDTNATIEGQIVESAPSQDGI